MPNALQFATPVSSFIQGSQLAQQQQQNALAQQAQQFNLQQAQDSAQRQNNLRNAVPGALNGDQGAMNTVMQNDPNIGIKIKQFLLNASEEQKKIAQQNLQEHAQAAAWIDSASNPQEMNQRFQQVRQSMQARGEDMSMFPTQWTPGMSKQVIQGAMTFDQLLAQQKPVSVSANSSLVNPQTGKVIYTAPAAPDNTLKQVQMPDGSVKWMPASQAVGHNAPAKSGMAAGGSALSPDALQTAAAVVASDPTRMRDYASFGQSGQEVRTQINNAIGELKKSTGMTNSDFIIARARAKAEAGSMAKMVAQSNAINAYESLAKANGQRLLDLFDKVDTTGIPMMEGLIRGAKRAGGNVDAAELQSVLTTFQTETARILSNPNMTGVVSDAARHEIQQMASGNMSVGQAKRVINRLFTEMDLRNQFLSDQIGAAAGQVNVMPPQGQGQSQQGTQAPQAQPQAVQGGIPQGWSVQVH